MIFMLMNFIDLEKDVTILTLFETSNLTNILFAKVTPLTVTQYNLSSNLVFY